MGEFGLTGEGRASLHKMRHTRRWVVWIGWIAAPLNTWPVRLRWMVVLGLTALTALGCGLLQRTMESPFGVPDSSFYLNMAEGRMAEVPQPFASRPLAPFLARGLAAAVHRSSETGFVVLGWASLLFTLVVVFWMVTSTAAPRWMLPVVAAVPFWPQLLHGLALPDLPYTALLCCLLLFLAVDRPYGAASMLLPLTLARESTLLALVCLLIVGWRRLRWSGCLVATAAVVAGSLLVRRLSAGAGGNPEHLPAFFYMAAKLPWNLLRVVGVRPWSNLYPFLCATPQWQRALPLGPLHSVGFCAISPIAPLQAILALTTTFGLLPPLFVLLWRHRDRTRSMGLLQRFCLVYGGVSFVLAPAIGTWYTRLLGYGWPLLLVALPMLFREEPREAEERGGGEGGQFAPLGVLGFLAIHLALTAGALVAPSMHVVEGDAALECLGIALLCTPARCFLLRSKAV